MRSNVMVSCAAMFMAACTSTGNESAAIDRIMSAYSGNVPGASLLVAREGKPVVQRSYGLAVVETATPATSRTNYRLASVTKQFTAAAVLLLAERGLLQLDQPVRTWLPSLPGATREVTVRHLLTHTSGLIDYEDLIAEGTTVQLRDTDVLRLLEKENRTYFAPGASYRYSNSGYALLALIVERVSGKTFATFLRDEIFRPLGMHRTVAFEEGTSTVDNRAFGYSASPHGWTRTDQSLTSAVLGDGGIYSSIDDLARWDAALTDRVLQQAFVPYVDTDDPNVRYGFGWRITGETVWHSGETIGFRNAIVRDSSRGVTVIILTNRNEGEPYRLALRIAELFPPTGAPAE